MLDYVWLSDVYHQQPKVIPSNEIFVSLINSLSQLMDSCVCGLSTTYSDLVLYANLDNRNGNLF